MKALFVSVVLALILFSGWNLFEKKNKLGGEKAVIPGIYEDDYWLEPQAEYDDRKQIYLDYASQNHRNIGGRQGVFSQIARMENGVAIDERLVKEAIDFVYSNRDCNDFTMGGLLRLLYLNKEKKVLSESLVVDIENALLWFKYWWSDARKDNEYRCYHTENHQALYHSVELLAGQLLKERKFESGLTGREHIEHALPLMSDWIEYRIRFGFSEWLSNVYYSVDIMTLANLYDFSENESIRDGAGLLLDMLMYDLAINNFKGILGSTTGRTYSDHLRLVHEDEITNVLKLMFGVGVYSSAQAVGVTSLVSSDYRCPEVIERIANDYSQPIRSLQRHSINVEEAELYGLDTKDEFTTHLFWGMQEFIHPDVVEMSQMISNKYDVWPYGNGSYDYVKKKYQKEIEEHGSVRNPHQDRFAMSEANIETYRTPSYMLSSVQDYRPGSPGYQQHIWQATLGVDALVHTSNPGSYEADGGTPNFYAGNARLPRAAQHKNVLVAIYNIAEGTKLPLSKAYFPTWQFDEYEKIGSWIFGRKGNAFLALYSSKPTDWRVNRNGQPSDLVVRNLKNIWICEMGEKAEWKSFAAFKNAISSASIRVEDELFVEYISPIAGKVSFGWEEDFAVNGRVQLIEKYPRIQNQFSDVMFENKRWVIKHNDEELVLDFKNRIRSSN